MIKRAHKIKEPTIGCSDDAKDAISSEFGSYRLGVTSKKFFSDVPGWAELLNRVKELSEESFTLGQRSMKRRGKPNTDRGEAFVALYKAIKPQVSGKELILDCNLTDFGTMLEELLDTVYPHLRYAPDPVQLSLELTKGLEEIKDVNFKSRTFPAVKEIIDMAVKVANAHAERALQAVFDMPDEEYEKLQTNIRELVNPLKEGNLEAIKRRRKELEELGKGNEKGQVYHVPVGVNGIRGQPSNLSGPDTNDPWKQRSKYMVCGSCMNYQAKGFDTFGRQIGACKNNSPTIKGYPRAFFDEKGCGAHKLAVLDKPK